MNGTFNLLCCASALSEMAVAVHPKVHFPLGNGYSKVPARFAESKKITEAATFGIPR